MEGLVFRSTGSWYEVRSKDGHFYKCRLRGKIKLKGKKTTNPVAVGDHVVFHVEENTEEQGIITKINERENYIIRKSTRKIHYGHIIAANVDQAVLIASLIFPRTSLGFIDRFLVSAESFRIPAKIIFNKSDLLDEELKAYVDELCLLYDSLGYQTLQISATKDKNLDLCRALLKGNVTLLSGHSGVGKSTILNRLDPDLELPTEEVSMFAEKGVHTTTFAEMFQMEDEILVIDTPGIKEYGLIDMEEWEISHYFPEMRDRLNSCKYNDCLHTNEPGCNIIKAVEEGEIAFSRYESYVSIIIDEDNRR